MCYGVHGFHDPYRPTIRFTYDAGDPLCDPSLYRLLVGKLFYLTISRPDIAYADLLLSQLSQSPYISHSQALLRVLIVKVIGLIVLYLTDLLGLVSFWVLALSLGFLKTRQLFLSVLY